MSQNFFKKKHNQEIAEKIKIFLNAQKDIVNQRTANSPRAVGDAIQEVIQDNFNEIVGNHAKNINQSFARRAMADLAFEDNDDNYYIVDVKTHRLDTKFNMPNLTSVERLTRFYEDDKNYFTLLMVTYDVKGTTLVVHDVYFIPIEQLDWSCLTIGALGWGQIQIANSNNIILSKKLSRRDWMVELCDTMLEFYPKEVLKISKRILHFEKIRTLWLSK